MHNTEKTLTAATDLFARSGYTVLAKDYRTRLGSIDFVIDNGRETVFVEVRSRNSTNIFTSAWSGIEGRKCVEVRRNAAIYLSQVTDRPRNRNLRFDALTIVWDCNADRLIATEWLEGAF